MKLKQIYIHKQSFKMLAILLLALLMGGCSADVDNIVEKDKEMVAVSFALSFRGFSTASSVSEVRLLAFDAAGLF